MNKDKRMTRLSSQLLKAEKAYYQKDDPIMSDADYDRMKREYMDLEKQLGHVSSRIGAPPMSNSVTGTHAVPMLSLKNAFTEEDVQAFLKTAGGMDQKVAPFVIEPKIDGLSLSLRYDQGKLVQALTRGDGRTGEDVTDNAVRVDGIPRDLPSPVDLEIRGEVWIGQTAWKKLNALRESDGENPYASPRHAASGCLRTQVPKADRSSLSLRFNPWGMTMYSGDMPRTQYGIHQLAAKLKIGTGLKVMPGEPTSLWRHVKEMISLLKNGSLGDMPADGVVIKVNDLATQTAMGSRSTSPRWAIAVKPPDDGGVWTRISKIDVQVGRSGTLTPVARTWPVTLNGIEIQNVTLHNPDHVQEMDIRAWDWVHVVLAGSVIPRITQVDTQKRDVKSTPWSLPETCPSCHTRIQDGLCPNRSGCSAQIQGRIRHAVSRPALNVKGLGDQVILDLEQEGWLKRPADVFELRDRSLSVLPGWGEISAKRLLTSIEKSRTTTLDRFLVSLGLPHLGPKIAKDMAAVAIDWSGILEIMDQVYTPNGDQGPNTSDVSEDRLRVFQGVAGRGLHEALNDVAQRDEIDHLAGVLTIAPFRMKRTDG